MKLTWMALAIGLIFAASPASAADMKLDLNIPEVNVEGLQGNGNAVALWVEDVRQEKILGKNLQGDDVVLGSDVVAAVMANASSSLRTAGFKVEPYQVNAPVAMLISIKSLSYAAEKGMVTNTAKLSARFIATLSSNGVMVKERTIGTSGEYTLTLWAGKKKISELVSESLGDTVSALLQDSDTVTFLKEAPQGVPAQ
ncbi:MAG: hypothetical protein COW19_01915 [Zetaproteobacteria bacterium CG12_big_fil_rev_8_21_14_0_65_55_1124]|nr:MAG: hypothetical protein AUJ58_10045 [Zetaproteobacteria bacterium CG1_02_55_237]PIS19955.1 MAG: hypothetical protein COT53_02895 [Zetaproteobacteria bacterium CG08_land_8_20_14_0_20_55_17]PIW43623.1 MAG: hypothetical protein COW19_01915 [Zetaproteobacteria bacterium CG12_big_fil_rev_8_21_14_0_65_55_1124]PIY52709.1 MAG: hypothetical protein COZ01_06670 [Zetaproteobacteria bacterium CG_4_10_14_0_8_um_filter_55_43]PIZ37893.1 MAG: hypothetical protein COY36_08010 [Zetaproteobacteria bacterium 